MKCQAVLGENDAPCKNEATHVVHNFEAEMCDWVAAGTTDLYLCDEHLAEFREELLLNFACPIRERLNQKAGAAVKCQTVLDEKGMPCGKDSYYVLRDFELGLPDEDGCAVVQDFFLCEEHTKSFTDGMECTDMVIEAV